MLSVACSPLREGATLSPLRFPILTLDERQLTPALGYVFDIRWLMPGESIISILWKFARANGLPGHVLVHLMGVDVDPYEGVEPMRDIIDVRRVRRMLRLPAKVLHASLLDAGLHGRYHPVLRYCRQCAGRGYHSVTYQMFSEYRCPAHGRALETRCRHCGGETPYILNANLVESPYRCAWCRTLYSYGYPPSLSTKPVMRKAHRTAISRRFYDRISGSFGLSNDDHEGCLGGRPTRSRSLSS
ncbi:hypothetical protein SAMN05192543_11543 [Paraburkholderia megapolitana]|uniref:TniQ protein n=2 Tax=Paraburkholderia megapolitana TaxID=420953 RepID=A0A1I3VY96_9BURK|nr:hypothetical protein SAMN05192543_11543 [Paraburkholderia megapolitana]